MIPTTRQIFDMAWPLGLKAIMLHGIIVIDAYLVSPLGEPALAAMGLAGAIGGLLLGLLFAFSSATQIRIAQAFGSAGAVALKTGFYCGLLINLAAAAFGLALAIVFAAPVIDSFAQTPWIAEQAKAYLFVFLFMIVSEAVGQCFSSHFNGCGKTKTPFVGYLVSVPLNIGVSVVLIHGYFGFPAMGLVGAAIGTVAASVVRMTYLWAIFWRDHRAFQGVAGWLHGDLRTALRRHFRFSWPIAGTFISVSFGNQVCVLIYAKMSVNDFAAITLVAPWVQVLGTFGMAWAQATGILVAQLLGKQVAEPALDAFLSRAWRMAFVAASIVALTYLVFGLSAHRIYAGLQADTKAALWAFLPVLLVLPFPKGSNAICGQTLRASGDTVFVMNLFIASHWACKIPLTFLFVVIWNLPVAWVFALFLVEELFKFPLFHARLYTGNWKRAEAMA